MIRLRVLFEVMILVFGFGGRFRLAAQGNVSQPAQGAYPNSADGLKKLVRDILDATKSHDAKKETQLIHSLILPNDTPWFKAVFGSDLGDEVSSDYKDRSPNLESDLRRILEADVREGEIDLKIKTTTDPESADHPVNNILKDMEPAQPLYEVILSGRDQRSYRIAFDKDGKGIQASGDPDGYFFYIDGGFRFVPTFALISLPDGRPAPGHKEPPQPKLIKSVMAVYPEAARRAKVSGTVHMHLTVGTNGKVIGVTVKDGDPRLVEAAEECVRKWLFKPPQVDGKPIPSEIDVEVSFALR